MNLPRFSLSSLEDKVASLTTAQRVFLFVGTLVFLGALFYFFQYQPQAEVLAGLERKLSDQEKRLATLKKIKEELPRKQKEWEDANETFKSLKKQFPDEKEIPALLDTISLLGAQVGLENLLFQPQPEQTFEFHAMVPIRLDLVAKYHTLGEFFDRLSKLNRILKVDNLSITRSKASPLLEVACTIITYRFLEKPVEVKSEPKKKK